MGNIELERRRFEQAEQWYRRALEICERLGLERCAATEYHQLGMIAQARQRFDEAARWYRKAMEVYGKFPHPPLSVHTLAQMGMLRTNQGRSCEAVGWFGRALAIADQHNMRIAGRLRADLAQLLEELGEAKFTDCWREAFPGQTPSLDLLVRK